ncbi:tyrosine-type recombinase/integrase [Vibrio parahaemolyticus]|uniref:tyrosine-type recombinase/integrase n=1 Tax=Vibrio parahaemolyticus TaxID=670 RepID=UPI00358E458E
MKKDGLSLIRKLSRYLRLQAASSTTLITGCRLNELAQLRVGDVDLQGVPYLSINTDATDKKVKNESSIRKVPLTDEAVCLFTELIGGRLNSHRVSRH